MDDVARQDRRIFIRELLRPGRILGWGLLTAFAVWLLLKIHVPIGFAATPLLVWTIQAYASSLQKRFIHKRYLELWESCHDRLHRFHDAVRQMRKSDLAEFSEMPRTIDQVAHWLYRALRRADMTFQEVAASEGWMLRSAPPVAGPTHDDPQARELYRIADKNIAEYKSQLTGVMAGIQRTEAQAALFTTTLDTLRVKMLSYRLTGRKQEVSTQEFLESLTEAKMQLEAIDKALDELELTPFPKKISVMPPELPEDVKQQTRRGP